MASSASGILGLVEGVLEQFLQRRYPVRNVLVLTLKVEGETSLLMSVENDPHPCASR
jgi:hypothetical protein